MYIDSHAHFDIILEDTSTSEKQLLDGCKTGGLSYAVQVAIDIDSSYWSLAFAKTHADSGILCTLGIHPSSSADSAALQELDDLVAVAAGSEDSGLIFGIGECGLDFYRMRQNRDMQTGSFRHQINLAKGYGLPVIVHSRDAMEDTIGIIRETGVSFGIMHCFPGDVKVARTALDLGFYISFAGNVTYRSAAALHESARYVPLDRLLFETDAPFLAPVPLRGKKNRPEYVVNVYQFVSELRGEPAAKIIDAVYGNFMEIREHALKKV